MGSLPCSERGLRILHVIVSPTPPIRAGPLTWRSAILGVQTSKGRLLRAASDGNGARANECLLTLQYAHVFRGSQLGNCHLHIKRSNATRSVALPTRVPRSRSHAKRHNAPIASDHRLQTSAPKRRIVPKIISARTSFGMGFDMLISASVTFAR